VKYSASSRAVASSRAGACRIRGLGLGGRVVGWCQGAVREVGELAGGGDGVAFVGGEAVVGVVGDGEWCGGVGEAVPDDVVVAAGAEQDADGGGVAVLVAQVVVDPGDVEPKLAGVLSLNLDAPSDG